MRARPICVQKFVDHFQCPAALLPGRTHQATTATNCNENGVPDECDIAGGTSSDTNQNGVPDECEEILVPYRVEYGYDYMGRRVRRQSFEWDAAGAAWVGPMMDTKYVYDGWRVIEELNGVDPVNPDATTRQYTWGLDLAAQAGAVNSLEQAGGIGGLLALRSTSADYGAERSAIYFYDANGNVAQVVTITAPWYGEIYAHYEYTPYGQVLVEPLFDQPYRFSTKPFDSWTGLGYWGYRWYSPKTGRWVGRDLLMEMAGGNLYAAFSNSPGRLLDGLGLFSFRLGTDPPPNPFQSAIDESNRTWGIRRGEWLTMGEDAQWVYMRARLAAAIGMNGSRPDAERALGHFFGNTGTYLPISYRRLIGADRGARDHYFEVKWAAFAYARMHLEEIITSPERAFVSSATDPNTVRLSTDNWHKAIGGYRTWARATNVRCSGPRRTITMDLEVFLLDHYDWDPDAGYYAHSFAAWHEFGLAREFPQGGSLMAKDITEWGFNR